jgi:hypothetical protein
LSACKPGEGEAKDHQQHSKFERHDGFCAGVAVGITGARIVDGAIAPVAGTVAGGCRKVACVANDWNSMSLSAPGGGT